MMPRPLLGVGFFLEFLAMRRRPLSATDIGAEIPPALPSISMRQIYDEESGEHAGVPQP